MTTLVLSGALLGSSTPLITALPSTAISGCPRIEAHSSRAYDSLIIISRVFGILSLLRSEDVHPPSPPSSPAENYSYTRSCRLVDTFILIFRNVFVPEVGTACTYAFCRIVKPLRIPFSECVLRHFARGGGHAVSVPSPWGLRDWRFAAHAITSTELLSCDVNIRAHNLRVTAACGWRLSKGREQFRPVYRRGFKGFDHRPRNFQSAYNTTETQSLSTIVQLQCILCICTFP